MTNNAYSELEQKIISASKAYYETGNSPYTDEEFDALVELLKHENPNSCVLNTVGWGYSFDTNEKRKYAHKYGIIGSLPKCHSYDELSSELKSSSELDLSLKLDGLSVVLYYEHGILYRALTRGDGHEGIDITDKMLKISPSVYTLDFDTSFTGAIRGEIIMSYEYFEIYQANHPDASNPRNVAAGLINRLDTPIDDLTLLDVVLYTVVGSDTISFPDIDTVRKFLNRNFTVPIVPYIVISTMMTDHTFRLYMEHYKAKWYNKYPADGIVITSDVVTRQSEVTYIAQAFKFPSERKITKVEAIEWNLSKAGNLVPKLKVTPVELAGTTVQFCTAFNANYVQQNKLGIGSEVEITKSGEIIPYITQVISHSDDCLPTNCPSCKEPLIWDGVHLKCRNGECANLAEKDLLIWIMNLTECENIGEKIILAEIRDYIDKSLWDDITVDAIMTDTDVKRKIDDSINQSSIRKSQFYEIWQKLHTGTFTLYQALRALNIPRLGDKLAMKLSQMPEIADKIRRNKILQTELAKLIGDANSKSIFEHIDKFKRISYVWDRLKFPVITNQAHRGAVVLTGKLSIPRKDFERQLRDAGYGVLSAVSSTTTFLITDNPNSGSAKNKQADKLGITKITEQDFREKFL